MVPHRALTWLNKWVLAAGVLALGSTATAQPIVPVDLGTLNGSADSRSYAEWVSDTGVVAGRSDQRAFVWTSSMGMQELVPGRSVRIADISRTGNIAATAYDGSGQAYFWSEQTGIREIGFLPGGTRVEALRVTDSGVVFGYGDFDGCGCYALFAWAVNTGFVNISALGGAIGISATHVNQKTDTVAGWFQGSNYVQRGFVWSPVGGFTEIGTLGGGASQALLSNDAGMVLGLSTLASDQTTAGFVWTRAGGMSAIIAPDNGNVYLADMNATGTVVGTYTRNNAPNRAFRWTQAGGLVDLLPLSVYDSWAFNISDDDVVTGMAHDVDLTRKHTIWADGLVTAVVPTFLATGCANQPARFGECNRAVSRNGVAALGGYVWTRSTGLVPLPPGAYIDAISDNGIVAFSYEDANSNYVLAAWAPGRGLLQLQLPGGAYNGGEVYALSPTSGWLVGESWEDSSPFGERALAWVLSVPNVASTSTGSDVVNQPVATLPDGSTATVGVTFGNVSVAGQTTVTTSTSGPPPPDGFKITGGQRPIYYDVSTTATFSGAVTLCFSWSEGQLRNENNARLFHYESNQWRDITISVDTVGNKVCGTTTSLSPFFIGEQRVFGFYAPIDNAPVVNSMRAGAAVPVKFSLGGDEGLNILAAGYPLSQSVVCSSAFVAGVEETVTAGNSTLSYDTLTDQYSYTWKTDKAWAGTCRQLSLKLQDGTVKTAQFKFTR